jgi:Rrf2 family nitric oxide-sensitive transcriptional repressor
MQLTRHTDYALRVLLYLAHHEGHCTISAIASRYDISHNHLMKVVHELGKAGYVSSVRGRYGGIRLARPAAEINIGEVILAVEKDFEIAACHDCRISGGCGLQGIFGEALSAFFAVLKRYSLADVATQSGGLEKLLTIHTGL